MAVKMSFGKKPLGKNAAYYKMQRDAMINEAATAAAMAKAAMEIHLANPIKSSGDYNKVLELLKAKGLPMMFRNRVGCQAVIILEKQLLEAVDAAGGKGGWPLN